MFFHRSEVLAGWLCSMRDRLVAVRSNHTTKTRLLLVLEAALGLTKLLDKKKKKNSYCCAAEI